MGRRTFENRSRLQNTREITRIRDKWTGQVSDLPGNILKPSQSLEMVNATAWNEYCKSRGGLVEALQLLPGISEGYAYLYTQSGTTVSCYTTGGASHRDFVSDDASYGRLLFFDVSNDAAGEVEYPVVQVVSVGGAHSATVSHAQTIATAREGNVRGKLNGFWYNKQNDVFIAHVEDKLYQIGWSDNSWTEIFLSGSRTRTNPSLSTFEFLERVGNSQSTIRDIDDDCIVYNANGVFRINVVDNDYYQINCDVPDNALFIDPGTSTIIIPAGITPTTSTYNRRYTYTLSRMSGDDPYTSNRRTLKIESESGAINGDAGTDYLAVGQLTADNQTRTIGGFEIPDDGGPFTHISIYGTQEYQQNAAGIPIGLYADKANKFTWLDDIILCKPLFVSITAGDNTVNPETEQFTDLDLYRVLIVIDYDPIALTFLVRRCKILTINPNGSCEVSIMDSHGAFKSTGETPAGIDCEVILNCDFVGGRNINVVYAFECAGLSDDPNAAPDPITNTVATWDGVSHGQILFGVITSDTQGRNGGRIFTVEDVTDLDHFTLKEGGFDTIHNICLGYSPSPAYYRDSYTNAEISQRTATLSLQSRFLRPVPSSNIGEIAPGWMILASENAYYNSALPNGYKYYAGYYHPLYQYDKVSAPITALTVHDGLVGILTANNAFAIQSNVSASKQDVESGRVVPVLPQPYLIDDKHGVAGMRCVDSIRGADVVCFCNDGTLRIFTGYSMSESISQDTIENKLKAIFDHVVIFDYNYGIVILGKSEDGIVFNDRFYRIGIVPENSLGAGEFADVFFSEQYLKPAKYNERVIYFNGKDLGRAAENTVRMHSGEFAYIDDDLNQDFLPCTPFDIESSITTGDDIGETQHYFLKHLESHIYASPDGSYLSGLQIDLNAYNDIGTYVAETLNIGVNNDINFDLDIVGHRIRYKIVFNKASWILNSLMSYYEARDKIVGLSNSEETDNQNTLLGFIASIGRREAFINEYTGTAIQALAYGGAWDDPTSDANPDRNTGPDGIANSAFSRDAGDSYYKLPVAITNDFTILFWINAKNCNLATNDKFIQDHSGVGLVIGVNGTYASGGVIVSTPDLQVGDILDAVIYTPVQSANTWTLVRVSYDYSTGIFTSSINAATSVAAKTHLHPISPNLSITSPLDILPISDGILFDVRVFNSILTDAEIEQYYYDVINNAGKRFLTARA